MNFDEILNTAVAITGALKKARHIPVGESQEVLAPDFNMDDDPDGVKIKYKNNTYEIEGFIVKKVS